MAAILRFEYSSDRSLLVRFDDAITAQGRSLVARFTRMLEKARRPEVINVHPAYNSVLVVFDALAADHDRMVDLLSEVAERMSTADLPPPKRVEIPVRYGGADGPDLEGLAAFHRLTPAQAIELHAGAEYEVAFLGFSPGFAYLAGLPAELATPRLDRPRPRVEPGSVGIAGGQTGVYPSATPGGWRLIGRTALDLFDPRREPACLLAPGDQVRFVPVSR